MSKGSKRKRPTRPIGDPAPELPELEWIPYMETWMFVVGYTEGGAPYGLTLEELPENDRELLLAELEDGKQPPPPVLEEEVVDVVNPFALWSAESADELHWMLVFLPRAHVVANDFEPFNHLRHFHRNEPSTTITSALLMLTHLKWKPAVGRLAASIAESGMLDDEQLEMLARSFVSAGDALYWRLPAHWPEAAARARIRQRLPWTSRRNLKMSDRWSQQGRYSLPCADGVLHTWPGATRAFGGSCTPGRGSWPPGTRLPSWLGCSMPLTGFRRPPRSS